RARATTPARRTTRSTSTIPNAGRSCGSTRRSTTASSTASCACNRGDEMRPETLAIHSGYEVEPTTKSVAVPIYQTVAYAFDSADHGAAPFNLEAEGYRYSRISNPTTAVLEWWVAPRQGRGGAPRTATRRPAPHH